MFATSQKVSMEEIEAQLPQSKEELDTQISPEPSSYHEPNGVPVFTPDYDTFKDFYKFVRSIEHYGHKAGLVKIIPPKEWVDQQNTSLQKLEQVQIQKALSQNFNCGGLPAGAHRQLNIEVKKKAFSGILH
jgi:hypothetical protein